MPKTKICKCCGKEFISKHGSSYCSYKCVYEATMKPKPKMPKICIECGKEFTPIRSSIVKLCPECRQKKLEKPNITKICKQCGREFVPYSNNQVLCYRCKSEEHISIKICEYCGKEFTTHYPYQKCCSKECYREKRIDAYWENRPYERYCIVCGKQIPKKLHPFKLYCSEECRKIGRKKARTEWENYFKEEYGITYYTALRKGIIKPKKRKTPKGTETARTKSHDPYEFLNKFNANIRQNNGHYKQG